MYSGFLPINDTTKSFHYIATTSETPITDKLIFWFNGGPGCSSLFGMTMEIGPYVMGDEDTRFKRNPYPWNREAHVVYIEMPAGVGYSTCDEINDSSSPGIKCYDRAKRQGPLNDLIVA
jgi:carboxypeptidase C (cathepsin A)